jgi:predicted amidohydrolase
MHQPLRRYTRVAVVQVAYHPAAVVQRRSPLEDPLFEFARPDQPPKPDSLLPESGDVPARFKSRLDQLRRRIRETYDEQLLERIKAILGSCRTWQVQLVVFPEYSIPWEILGGVADAAGDMVVIAGTHAVTRAARQSGIYEKLGVVDLPDAGMAVCPVLHQGRLLGLQAKWNPAVPEQDSLVPGRRWQPIALPETIPGPCGVMICLDFLYREGPQHHGLVSETLPACRFLAVPSLTPHYTLGEFAGKAWEEARRYGRPVLYADIASGGGTSIYVDEGAPTDLRRFPDQAGYLEKDDEGVIVADVDLGYERVGRSTRYDAARPIRPVAAASFVYRAHAIGEQYAAFLEKLSPLIDGPAADTEAAIQLIEGGRDLLLNAGAVTGAKVRGHRLQRLVNELDYVNRTEELQRFLREVMLPPGVLPLADLRAALAKGAADVVFGWREELGTGWANVEDRLREAGKRVATPEPAQWTEEGVRAIARVGEALQEPREQTQQPVSPTPEVQVQVVLPEGLNPAALGDRRCDDLFLQFRSTPADLRWFASVEYPDYQQLGRPVYQTREGGLLPLPPGRLRIAEELLLLARAEGFEHVAAVGVLGATGGDTLILIVFRHGNSWQVWADDGYLWTISNQAAVLAALVKQGLSNPIYQETPGDSISRRITALLPRFAGARATVQQFRQERLRDLGSRFVQPKVRVNGEAQTQRALEALDAWVAGSEQTALVLGEFGSGKSTLLAEWALARWDGHLEGPRPILCSLGGAGPSADAEALLLLASSVPDTAANRAALLLLISRRQLLPIFDGFDEMATRLTPPDLAGRLAELLRMARGGGQVVVSSRDHYFPTENHLRTVTEQALAAALGQSSGLRRLTVQLFDESQVRELVTAVRGSRAEEALERIAHLYPLQELVSRPLLLGMVLQTLDSLQPTDRISRAEIFEKYLQRWLEQTHHQGQQETFTDEQKAALAEALAEQLWRSGQPSCSPEELKQSVRALLLRDLPEDLSAGAAFLEIFGGSYFVREPDDRYRFAHKSFQEFFLARSLLRTLPERPAEVLATPRPITPEVAGFLGELLRREGDPRRALAIQAVQAWLSEGRRASAAGDEQVVATSDAAALVPRGRDVVAGEGRPAPRAHAERRSPGHYPHRRRPERCGTVGNEPLECEPSPCPAHTGAPRGRSVGRGGAVRSPRERSRLHARGGDWLLSGGSRPLRRGASPVVLDQRAVERGQGRRL